MSKNNVESIRTRLKNIANKECKPFDFILMLGVGFRYTVCKIALGESSNPPVTHQ